MENYQMEQYAEVGLMAGGVTVLGTALGAGVGFLASGGASEFLNQGWIWTVNGSVIGSLIASAVALLGLARYIKQQQSELAKPINPHVTAGLRFGAWVILGTIIGGINGFVWGGGPSEFLNHGWIFKVTGMVLGSMIASGIGLIGWANYIKRSKVRSER